MNAQRDLVIVGVPEHNLKHIDVRIPRGALTVITCISGSGKSSLAWGLFGYKREAREKRFRLLWLINL
jgi:excinuclease UvrABC ATPase subunit